MNANASGTAARWAYTQRTHRLLEDARHRRLADPAQRQTAQRHPELHGGKKISEILLQSANDARGGVMLRDQLLDARLAHADQRELRRYKKAVRQNQNHNGDAVKEQELRHWLRFYGVPPYWLPASVLLINAATRSCSCFRHSSFT